MTKANRTVAVLGAGVAGLATARLLKRNGMKVVSAKDGIEALELLSRALPEKRRIRAC